MAYVCGLSGEVPNPARAVVSLKNGKVYDEALLTKYVAEHKAHPGSDDQASMDDTVKLEATTGIPPRNPQQASVPAMLKLFQDEWDALMLETYTLRQQLNQARQQLSHSLYQNDAACRIIARLTRERDMARNALGNLAPNQPAATAEQSNGNGAAAAVPEGATDTAMEGEDQGAGLLSAEVVATIKAKSTELSTMRKNKDKPTDLPAKQEFAAFTEVASHPGLHGSTGKGITTFAVHASNDAIVASGGMDKNVTVFNRAEGKLVHKFKGHTKKVMTVALHPEAPLVFSAGADKSIRVHNYDTKETTAIIKGAHKSDITCIALHPTNTLLVSTSTDGSWALTDVTSEEILMQQPAADCALTTCCFHPDGLYMSTGATNGAVTIWDMEKQQIAAEFDGHTAAINAMSFSEGGRYFATSDAEGVVKVWDLKKLKTLHTITVDGTADIKFDPSGQYLFVAGTGIKVFLAKKMELIHDFEAVTATVTKVGVGLSTKSLAFTATDRAIHVLA